MLILLLSGCAPGISVSPNVYCTGSVQGLTWEEKAWDAYEKCIPIIQLTIKSWVLQLPEDEEDGQ